MENNIQSRPQSIYPIVATVLTGAGALGGAAYAATHPSKSVCDKIEKIGISAVDTFKGYGNAFNIDVAADALVNKKLTENEFNKTKEIYDAVFEAMEREKEVKFVSNTPINQRKVPFEKVVKKANEARKNFRKVMLNNFSNEFKEKLTELGVFNKEEFQSTMEAAYRKSVATTKILSKYATKGALIGASVGAALTGIICFLGSKTAKPSK